MGNRVATMSYKFRRRHKKPKGVVEFKVISKPIVQKHHSNDEEVFFTPKSYHSEDEEDQQNKDNMKISEELLSLDSQIDIPTFVCEICVESRALNDSFSLMGCAHFYCTECTVRYVSSKLDDNLTSISCPVSGCEGVLEPDYCRNILPKDVFDRWGVALCESVIDNSQKFYCPYEDCSVLLINDTGGHIENTVCPFCEREFCVKCKVPWHPEINCKKFQKLKKKGDDSLFVDLAKRKNWRRCPKCKYYVERSLGCFYMKCRCGHAFCYRCGARSSTTSHSCPKCKH
ncbi:probable E3 ubiquitin-protein ligase RNF217 isoform X2 [Manihot esculenta]|uniref:RBR-type E3 ubiquitin transferase n=1 Tax=Manihot esculenta TaxID=3983 RepID=A0A2C9W6P2_MANES|nr:probable E3 ubiquitin-protein ligase RNF217 isoform X2 [Manihot esculenta]OAY54059.1 hypothetical protein MANES_03G045100v8 [Manihot esculenta]